jgi:hypothetical protein
LGLDFQALGVSIVVGIGGIIGSGVLVAGVGTFVPHVGAVIGITTLPGYSICNPWNFQMESYHCQGGVHMES